MNTNMFFLSKKCMALMFILLSALLFESNSQVLLKYGPRVWRMVFSPLTFIIGSTH